MRSYTAALASLLVAATTLVVGLVRGQEMAPSSTVVTTSTSTSTSTSTTATIPVPAAASSGDFKIAFLFLTRGPMPLEPIWDAFFHWNADPSQYSIYIHPHNDYQYTPDSLFYGHEVRTPGLTQWGALSVTSAIQALVRKALEDPSNKWFTLMSEACIPLHPLQMWRRALSESDLSVVNACPHDDNRAKSEDMTEVEARWKPQLAEAGIKRSEWRKSATWFALNRKHAQLFADDTKILSSFIQVPIPDEHYVPTLLAHYGLDNETACSDGFMHHLFTPTGAHPTPAGPSEITADLIRTIDSPQGKRGFGLTCSGRNTLCHFTARKFTVHSLFALTGSLDLLLRDGDVHFKGTNPLQKRLRVSPDGSNYYLLIHGELTAFPFKELGPQLGFTGVDGNNVTRLTTAEMATLPQIPSPFPHVVDGEICKLKHNAQVYLIMSFARHPIDSIQVFDTLGLSFGNLRLMPDHELGILPLGEAITAANVQHWKDRLTTVHNLSKAGDAGNATAS
jgi:hypothetical protein